MSGGPNIKNLIQVITKVIKPNIENNIKKLIQGNLL